MRPPWLEQTRLGPGGSSPTDGDGEAPATPDSEKLKLELRVSRRSFGINLRVLDWTKSVSMARRHQNQTTHPQVHSEAAAPLAPVDVDTNGAETVRETTPAAPPDREPIAEVAAPLLSEVAPVPAEVIAEERAAVDVGPTEQNGAAPVAEADAELEPEAPQAFADLYRDERPAVAAPLSPPPPPLERGTHSAVGVWGRRVGLTIAVLAAFAAGMVGASQLLPASSDEPAQAGARQRTGASPRPARAAQAGVKKKAPARPRVQRRAAEQPAPQAPAPTPEPDPVEQDPVPPASQEAPPAEPRLVSWQPVPKARFYWFQLYKLRASGAENVLEAFPTGPQFTVAAQRALVPGRYRWIAWPQFGARSELDYGSGARAGVFRIERSAAADGP